MTIKNAYNSIESKKTYTGKESLFPIEKNIFELIPKDSRILDLGCGAGRTTIALYRLGFHNIIGIDFANELIESAKEQFPEIKDKFSYGDATDLEEFENESFDVVFFSYNGIDYIPTRDLRIKAYIEIARVLKKGGIFIFSSHNRRCLPINRNLLFTHLRNLFRIKNEYWVTRQSFGDVETYYSTLGGLTTDLEKVGLKKIFSLPRVPFLYPFFDTFPYYLFKKI